MMDYYSNFPAPSYEECKKKLVTDLYNSVTIQELAEKQIINVNDIVEQAFVLSDMLDNKNSIKYSLTGWNVTGYSEVLGKAFYIIDEIHKERKKRNKRLIRGLFKSTFLLIKNLPFVGSNGNVVHRGHTELIKFLPNSLTLF